MSALLQDGAVMPRLPHQHANCSGTNARMCMPGMRYEPAVCRGPCSQMPLPAHFDAAPIGLRTYGMITAGVYRCLRKCPVCTFFGDAAVGHCKKKGDLFRCQHTEPDGIDGNEGNEGDEGSEGDEGNEGNEGNTGGVGNGAANALTAQKVQRSVPLPTALPGGSFTFSASADGTYARGYDDDGSETYFREFEGFFIEAGSHIEVDYEHSMGKVAPPEGVSAPEDWPLATGDHAGRRMLGLSGADVDADGAEVPPEAEEQMYYLDDGSVVEWGPYIHVSYDNPQPFPDTNPADYDP